MLSRQPDFRPEWQPTRARALTFSSPFCVSGFASLSDIFQEAGNGVLDGGVPEGRRLDLLERAVGSQKQVLAAAGEGL